MDQQIQNSTFGKHYLQAFANGIKRFTQSKWMVAIVNAFISVMPIIIAASIFTLFGALPEMVMSIWREDFKDYINAHIFESYQNWASTISNWSMGVIGLFATAAIARNLAIELNNKLPFERRMNEVAVFFAAMSVYFMLSVIEFTVGSSTEWQAVMPDHTGRAIFVDGLAAQGILPGIIIGLTVPYVFYISYKNNWTIRLPKQVPQTISQAFLAIIPLVLTYGIYGTIGFTFNLILGEPILFALFEQIQKGLTNNQQINDSYGLICIYTLMEGGFWFLGVHPEPVHALMRASFWVDNINANASGSANHIFIEPLMYGYGAMGGSGCTLMLPLICLFTCKSTQMKVTGKTAVLPIVFQVNEPALFGVPTILNPLFAFPMIFTGMINDVLFKAFVDNTSYVAGSLYLPWSTPYFLQTALPTPFDWHPWVFNMIALAICTLTYLPFVLLQDKEYLKVERAKMGINGAKYNPTPVININLTGYLKGIKKQFTTFKNSENKKLEKSVAAIKSKYESNVKRIQLACRKEIIQVNTKAAKKAILQKKRKALNNEKNACNEKLDALHAKHYAVITQAKYNNLYEQFKKLISVNNNANKAKVKILKDKKATKAEKVDALIEDATDALNNKKVKISNKITSVKSNIDTFNKIKENAKARKLSKVHNATPAELNKLISVKHANWKITRANKKMASLEAKLQKLQELKPSVKRNVKDLDVLTQKKVLKLEKRSYKKQCRIYAKFNKKAYHLIRSAKKHNVDIKKVAIGPAFIKLLDVKKLNKKYDEKYTQFKNRIPSIKKTNKQELLAGINPWVKQEQPIEQIAAVTTKIVKKAPTPSATNALDPTKKYQVLVLCLGAGSSAVLANTINKGLKQTNTRNIKAVALAWGQHEAALKSSDLVILSPQLGLHARNLSKQAEALGFKLLACKGRDYIDLSKNPKQASNIVVNQLTSK